MSADRTTQNEARQIALGADCVLHDPVRMEILFEYLAKYRTPLEVKTTSLRAARMSFLFAGAEVHSQERRLVHGGQSLRIAPQEVALLNILSCSHNRVVPYPVLYGDLFGRRFDGDTANCRVLLGKLSASFKNLGIELKPFVQVIPKSGYLYTPLPIKEASHSPRHPTRPKSIPPKNRPAAHRRANR